MTNRRIYNIIFSFLLLLCLMPAVLQAKEPVRTVRVGFFMSDGYQMVDGRGHKYGYGYDFLLLLERYSNMKFVYVGVGQDRSTLLDMLERGDIDLVTSVHKEPDRVKKFDFSYPIGSSSLVINVRYDDNRFIPYDFERMNGIKIGFANKHLFDVVQSYANENGFTFTPCFFDDNVSMQKALISHKLDAMVTNSLYRLYNVKSVAELSTKNFYAIVQKGNRELLNEINEAITQMNENESNWQTDLYSRNYIRTENTAIKFTPAEEAYIKAHSTSKNPVILATDNNWKPFSQKRGNSYRGIIPDFWSRVFDMAGMKYRYYDSCTDIFSLDSLKCGKADIYLDTSLSPRDAEELDLLVSPPFMNVGASLLYRKSHPEIKTVALCSMTKFLNEHFMRNQGYTTKMYPTIEKAVNALNTGEVDALFCYTYDAQRLENNDFDGSLSYRIIPGVNIDLRAVTPLATDHALLSIVSKCILRLQGSQTDAIVSRNLSYSVTNFRLRDWMQVHPHLATVGFMIAIIVFFAVFRLVMRFRLREQINKAQKKQLDEIGRLNTELRTHQTQLEEATAEAKAANAAKTSFLFNMSHDIRTPMNAIMGFRDLLEKHQDDPEKRADYLKKIADSSKVLLSIINNVLEMARIEKGTVLIEETVWCAEQFNDTIYPIFLEMMQQKHITFEREINIEHPYVYCDPIKLREIFFNILSNAYKYTNSGGSVFMKLEEIPSDREGYVFYRTTISDTGIGMSEDFLPHLFDEFSRENSTTETKIEGTGLGMPIVKRLIEMLEGTVEVKSKKGIGTTFIVTMPHRIADKSSLVERDGVVLDPKIIEGRRILLAEDNDFNAEIAIEILTEEGLKIERAENGKICCEMLSKAPADYYDVILMDIQMPVMNGYEAARTIRSMQDTAKSRIPILAMTANAFEEDKREAKRAGMDGHLAKPIDVAAILKELARVLN